MGWRVRADAVGTQPLDPRVVMLIRDALHRLGVQVTFDRYGLTIRVTVEASSPHEAAQKAMDLVRGALPDPRILMPVRLEVAEELASAPSPSGAAEIIGIAELATMLLVTKQRASELAKSPEFPRPLAILKAGPVWTRASVARYLTTWQRRPGRPPRKAQAA